MLFSMADGKRSRAMEGVGHEAADGVDDDLALGVASLAHAAGDVLTEAPVWRAGARIDATGPGLYSPSP